MRPVILLLLLLVGGSLAAQQAAGLDDAWLAMEQGRTREAVRIATSEHDAAMARNDTDLAVRSAVLLTTLLRQSNEPVAAYERAIHARALSPLHPGLRTADHLNDLAALDRDIGLYARAEERLDRTLMRSDLTPAQRTEALAIRSTLHPDDAGLVDEVMLALDRTGARTPSRLIHQLQSMAPADQLRRARLETRLAELCRARGSIAAAATHLNNAGLSLMRTGSRAEAGQRYEQALELLSSVASVSRVRQDVLMNQAVLFNETGRRAEGLRQLEGLVRWAEREQASSVLGRALLLRGGLHYLDGRLAQAADDATRAADLAEGNGTPEVAHDAFELLAAIARTRGSETEALQATARAAAHERRMTDRTRLAEEERQERAIAVQELELAAIEALAARERERSRFDRLALLAADRDEEIALLRMRQELEGARMRELALAREKAQHELFAAKAALDAERRDRTIAALSRERDLAAMRAGQRTKQDSLQLMARNNMLLATEARLIASENAEQRAARRSMMFLLATVLTICVALGVAVVLTRRRNQAISERGKAIMDMNRHLNEAHGKIMGSIEYARQIQASITPREEQLREVAPGSFLFYRPLDVVSGDLPFLLRVDHALYVGAIDCTGHGVPAAMLSFIAHYTLTGLLQQHRNASCGQILAALHDEVRETLKGQNPELPFNDGMDLSLCRIDVGTGRIQFAGAQLPILLSTSTGVEVVRGDRVSIGDRSFKGKATITTHERRLSADDRLYILSDGLIHQFGGHDGRRKFSLQRLADLLNEVRHLSPDESARRVAEAIDAWRGQVEQTDDMLLIGVAMPV